MNNIRDWCISRQIWWGHRIPAWYCDKCGKITVSIEDPSSCSHCRSSSINQDPDVLDTWFSSALWPFSTLGWPDNTKDFRTFYPTDVLVTSFDIIFFWVARMMMMGIKFTGQVPFRDVYIHALVRDISGKKMSKSRGNVIDPLFLMEKYGTDALRFTLIALAAQGRDIKISEERVAGYRNFANKIWNSARFVLMNIDEIHFGDNQNPPADLSLPDKWILTHFSRLISHIRESLGSYSFDEAGRALYQFFLA
jgi:valyl-tRNA synthetase